MFVFDYMIKLYNQDILVGTAPAAVKSQQQTEEAPQQSQQQTNEAQQQTQQ
jgi:hypothetical protein